MTAGSSIAAFVLGTAVSLVTSWVLVSRLERATAIVDELDRRLRRTRAQVEELVPRLESASSLEEGRDLGRAGVEPTGDRAGATIEDEDEDEDEDMSRAENQVTGPDRTSNEPPGLF